MPGLVLRMHGLQFILYSFCLGTLDHELFMRFCVIYIYIYPLENTPSRQKKSRDGRFGGAREVQKTHSGPVIGMVSKVSGDDLTLPPKWRVTDMVSG